LLLLLWKASAKSLSALRSSFWPQQCLRHFEMCHGQTLFLGEMVINPFSGEFIIDYVTICGPA
jgi:hypothetical protein